LMTGGTPVPWTRPSWRGRAPRGRSGPGGLDARTRAGFTRRGATGSGPRRNETRVATVRRPFSDAFEVPARGEGSSHRSRPDPLRGRSWTRFAGTLIEI